MILIDGNRSRSRKWFAEKQLRTIKDIDVPSKTVLLDGFRISVWQQGELSGGSVVAPMGLIVYFSTADGIKSCSADYWLGGFTAVLDMKNINTGVEDNTITEKWIASEIAASELLDPGVESGELPPRPAIMPYRNSEFVISTASLARHGSGTLVFESLVNMFNSDGSQSSRTCYYGEVDNSIYFNRQTLQLLPSTGYKVIRHAGGQVWQNTSLEPGYYRYIPMATIFSLDLKEMWRIYAITIWADIPTSLLGRILPDYYYEEHTLARWLGSYGYSPAADSPVTLLTVISLLELPAGDMNDYFVDPDTNLEIPEHREWLLFYTLYTEGGSLFTITAQQFIPILDTLANNKVILFYTGSFDVNHPDTDIDWDVAVDMLVQLLPFPNLIHARSIPYDSIMFHGPGGIYTWTRHYGAVRFSETGIEVVTLVIPPEVTTAEGVRPVITHSGNGLFLCVCENVNDKIEAIYTGSPFEVLPDMESEWTAVAMPVDKLLHVRPVFVSLTRLVLFGIVERTVDTVTSYFVSFLDTAIDAAWRNLYNVPVAAADSKMWDVALYGNGEYTHLMRGYLSPPPATPQETHLPNYTDYAVVGA